MAYVIWNIAYRKKLLTKISEGQFTCIVRSCWKIHKFSVPIEKEVNRIAKNGEETTKTISYKLKFIDSTRFMASSLSNLDKILAKEIHKIKCKYRYAKQM